MSDEPKDPRDPNERSSAPFESDDNTPDAARWKRPELKAARFPALPGETEPLNPPRRRAAAARPAPAPANWGRDGGRNLITLLFLLLTIGALGYFAVIWQNPYSTLNPLAPPTPLPLVITATLTATPTLEPSATFTPMPTLTPSEVPSEAPTLTFTPIFLEGFSTPQGTPPGTEDTTHYRFSLQRGRVLYLTNPDARGGCQWSSIAGSVMNYDGTALNGYGVHVVGEGVDQTVATGSAPGFGPGGFEVPLGNAARDAQYIAQLVDPQGNPASPVYTVETNSDCNFNIAALRFVENEPSS